MALKQKTCKACRQKMREGWRCEACKLARQARLAERRAA
jgi:hypothetical protein